MSGKVIKSVAPEAGEKRSPPRGAVVNAEEFDARQGARGIIDEANRKAQEIIESAQAAKEAAVFKARQDARAEVLAQSSTEIAKAKMQAGQVLAAATNDILELAQSVAAKIIGRDLQRDPAVLLEICANAIENVRTAKAMVLRVHPNDGALLREQRPKLMELLGRTLDIAIRDDADVEPGGCVIQTEFGTVDGQLKTQFEMLKTVLTPDAIKKDGSR